jgi:uncharacterized membrane protein (DUF2068 family)
MTTSAAGETGDHPPATAAGPRRPPGTQRPRRRRQIDWELVTCGVEGHVIVGRDIELPADLQPLVAHEAGDFSWHRCLRCDSWLVLPGSDTANPRRLVQPDEIELPLRGKPLRDRIVLRLIAIDRILHFVVLIALGIAVLAFTANRAHLRDGFYRVLAALQGGVAGGPVQTTGHVGILHDLDRLFTLRTGTLDAVGGALLGYGILEGIEAIGLWYAKRWAEYLTFVSTTLLLPLEIYEIAHGATPLKVIGFLINVAVVLFLLFRKRLFGVRGGVAADEAERRHDMGWEAIRRATLATPATTERIAPSG